MASKKHAELIRAWLDGAQIQYKSKITEEWGDFDEPTWAEDYEYRIKPAEPERVYPELNMTEEEVIAAWTPPYGWKGLLAFANKTLRHAIDAGQVVTREEFNKAVAHHEQRDCMLIDAAIEHARKKLGWDNVYLNIDYLRIIEKVA